MVVFFAPLVQYGPPNAVPVEMGRKRADHVVPAELV